MIDKFEEYYASFNINEVPDEVLALLAEEAQDEDEYRNTMNEYIDCELENEYYAQIENEYSKSE